jgi:hypothetical protein
MLRTCSIDGCSREFYGREMCHTHYQQWRRNRVGPPLGGRPYEERFWVKVDKNGPVPEYRPELGPCWIWKGATSARGYGNFGNQPKKISHRIAYELMVGAIPEGTEIDHLCRVRACCNPKHLEPVTRKVNQLRGLSPTGLNAAKDQCVNEHPFDEINTRITPKGRRDCRACCRERVRKVRAKRKQGAAGQPRKRSCRTCSRTAGPK